MQCSCADQHTFCSLTPFNDCCTALWCKNMCNTQQAMGSARLATTHTAAVQRHACCSLYEHMVNNSMLAPYTATCPCAHLHGPQHVCVLPLGTLACSRKSIATYSWCALRCRLMTEQKSDRDTCMLRTFSGSASTCITV
jgi:hypothetical protein